MIIVTPKGAPSPLVGRVKGTLVASDVSAPSVCLAVRSAVRQFHGETDGFLFVASGGHVNSARVWEALRRADWDVAAYVDRIGSPPKAPGAFNGIGRVCLDVLLFRPTEAGKRVLARWANRNAVRDGNEAVELAIALTETGVRFLQLGRPWIWREADMRALEPGADPVVEFKEGKAAPVAVPKISELATAKKHEAPVQVKTPPGVLWVGHLYQYTGYGKANREILFRIANTLSVRIDDSHNEPVYVSEDLRKRLDVHKSVLVHPKAPLLRIMGPDHIVSNGRHRIVWTMQESSVRVHADMAKRANENFDELWTPTKWNMQVFKDSGVKIPMRIAPLGVDTSIFRTIRGCALPPCRLISTSRRGLVAVPKGFVFLTVGLPGFRKGWDVVADAMELAFSKKKNVNFVIGLTHSPPAWNEKVYKQFAKYKVPIWTLEGSFDEHELARVYNAVDAYVSASRGEGWNLPAMEAASCGIPVIVPNNTVHLELFGSDAFLFDGDGEKTYPEGDWISDWYKGMLFTDFRKPSIRRLAEILETVRSMRGYVVDKAFLLQERVRSKYTWDAAARLSVERLLEVQP